MQDQVPDVDGNMLMSKIRGLYIMPERQTLPWFTASGKPALRRHPRNARDQHSSRLAYKAIVQAKGVIDGGRSELMAVMIKEDGEDIALFIAGATLVEAVYDAFDSPGEKSANLKFTRDSGLANVSIVDRRTPPDVLDEMVDTLNELNGIAGAKSFVEVYSKVKDIEAQWTEVRKQQRRQEKKEESSNAKDSKDSKKGPSYEVLS